MSNETNKLLDNKDGGIDFRHLHKVIKELEQALPSDSAYFQEFREAGLQKWSPQRVEAFIQTYQRAVELAIGTLRHWVAEFEHPYSGREFQFTWILLSAVMPYVIKTPTHMHLFGQILAHAHMNTQSALMLNAAGQPLPEFKLHIPEFE